MITFYLINSLIFLAIAATGFVAALIQTASQRKAMDEIERKTNDWKRLAKTDSEVARILYAPLETLEKKTPRRESRYLTKAKSLREKIGS